MEEAPSKKQVVEGDECHDTPEQLRRKFLKKFGKYAVTTPTVTFTLMSSMSSKAIASGGRSDRGPG